MWTNIEYISKVFQFTNSGHVSPHLVDEVEVERDSDGIFHIYQITYN